MIIYKATNKVNGKSYVGKTRFSLQHRQAGHKKSSEYEGPKKKSHFHKAIAKWGWENFAWEILEKVENESMLDEREKFFIAEHKTFVAGYNQTHGGEGQSGWDPSVETGAIWSEQRKGKNQYTMGYIHPASRPKTESELQQIEEEKKLRKEEANRKRSEALKGRVPWNKGKACPHVNTLEANKKRQTARRKSGYVWIIDVFDLDGNLVGTFESQTKCCNTLKLDAKKVRKVVNTEKPYKGYFFKKRN